MASKSSSEVDSAVSSTEPSWESVYGETMENGGRSVPDGAVRWSAAKSNMLAPGRTEGQTTGKASKLRGWQLARELQEADTVIEARASGYNKGGLLLDWHGLPGFVPASQLLNFSRLHVEKERLHCLRERQHQRLQLKIIEVDEETNRLIFSERATRVAATEREQLLSRLQVGEVRTGTVTNLADFGAFVDLGGVEGLLHISQLSWRRLLHPSDVVEPGQEVKVLILEVDENNERVALSRKQLLSDPWFHIEERYKPGQIVTAVISNVVDFGAFALVEDELEGLIHISELGAYRRRPPEEIVHKGNRVRARVLDVSESERRLALSLRGIENPILE